MAFTLFSGPLPVHFRSPIAAIDSAHRVTPRTTIESGPSIVLSLLTICFRFISGPVPVTDSANRLSSSSYP